MSRIALKFTPGLDTDDTTKAAKGTWADADGVRFHEGRPQTMGGWEAFSPTLLTGVCRNALCWTDSSNTLNYAFGTHCKLQVYLNSTLYDVTPTGLVAGNVDGVGGLGFGTGGYSSGQYSEPSNGVAYLRTWSLSPYGGSLMASPRGGTVYWWQNGTGTPAAAIAQAPAQVDVMIVPPNRRQVMCLGCTNTTGTYEPATIRWSSLQDPTTWTPPDGTVALASSTAGEYALEGGGRIVGVKALGDFLLIWTSGALYLATFTGGTSNLWSFSKLADHCGLIGPNAAAVNGQVAYWLSPSGQFWAYGLGGVPTPLPCPIRQDFFDNISVVQSDKITASSLSAGFAEVRWDYPDGRDGTECSRYLLLSTTDGEWSRGLQARSAFTDADPALFPLGVTPQGQVYNHEKGLSADGQPVSRLLESADLLLADDPVMIREMWPDFRDQQGAVQVYLIARDRPQGQERVYGPFPCGPEQARVQLRITTRYARLRLVSLTTPSFWRLGEPSLDVSPAGALGRR